MNIIKEIIKAIKEFEKTTAEIVAELNTAEILRRDNHEKPN